MAKSNLELEKMLKKGFADIKTEITDIKTEISADIKNQLEAAMKTQLEAAMKTLAGSIISEIKEAVVNDLNSSLKTQVFNIVEPIKNDLEAANCKIACLEAAILKLSERNEIESRDNNLILSGVPARPDDNLMTIVENLSSKLGFTSPPVHRSKLIITGNDQRRNLIQLKFKTNDDKQHFFSNYIKAPTITLKDIYNAESASRIYLNHDLTKKNYEIQKLASKLRKDKKILQFRIIHGKVGIKINTNEAKFNIIDDITQLNNLLN